jgi:hypothetical protein
MLLKNYYMKIKYYNENSQSLAKRTFQTFESNDFNEIFKILESRIKEYKDSVTEVKIRINYN